MYIWSIVLFERRLGNSRKYREVRGFVGLF